VRARLPRPGAHESSGPRGARRRPGSGTLVGVLVLRQDELPVSVIARELVGDDHGGLGLCIIFVDAPPGGGPRLHQHPYDEVLIVQEGEATFVAGDEERRAGAGEIVVVPAGTPHRFVNDGDGPLRQIDIHVSSHFATEWLEVGEDP
jgi:mannose-6-phosphate isomerase-like protein (cupin superfamily)